MSAITNRARASQLIDFQSLKMGKIMPTDLDAIIEWKNKGYILIECKAGTALMPLGQRICLERMVNDLAASGKAVVLLIARHKTKTSDDVDLGRCKVTQWYMNGEWYESDEAISVREACDTFIENL